MELEAKLREKTALVERLERDRRWLADREKEQQEERERERAEHAEEKVRGSLVLMNVARIDDLYGNSATSMPQFGTSEQG
jgi:hypothetical protein